MSIILLQLQIHPTHWNNKKKIVFPDTGAVVVAILAIIIEEEEEVSSSSSSINNSNKKLKKKILHVLLIPTQPGTHLLLELKCLKRTSIGGPEENSFSQCSNMFFFEMLTKSWINWSTHIIRLKLSLL